MICDASITFGFGELFCLFCTAPFRHIKWASNKARVRTAAKPLRSQIPAFPTPTNVHSRASPVKPALIPRPRQRLLINRSGSVRPKDAAEYQVVISCTCQTPRLFRLEFGFFAGFTTNTLQSGPPGAKRLYFRRLRYLLVSHQTLEHGKF